jgi:hypothetical protein
MNHGDKSPVGQGNAGNRWKVTGSAGSTPNDSRQTNNYKYLATEDLQKLRNSDHNCTQAMDEDDAEHYAIIKGLLYPGIEQDGDDDVDEFLIDEDYEGAQTAVNNAVTSAAPSNNALNSDNSDSQRSRHRLGNEYSDLVGEKLRR